MQYAAARVSIRNIFLFAIVLSVFGAPRAHAVLGKAESSVDSDRQLVASAVEHSRTQRTAYAVREFGAKALTVREYVSQTTGVVFAIVWNGRNHPSLETMLGDYYGEYRQATDPIRDQPRGRYRARSSRSFVTTDHLVIERGGKFGALSGRVYVRDQLPKEVKVDEIQ